VTSLQATCPIIALIAIVIEIFGGGGTHPNATTISLGSINSQEGRVLRETDIQTLNGGQKMIGDPTRTRNIHREAHEIEYPGTG